MFLRRQQLPLGRQRFGIHPGVAHGRSNGHWAAQQPAAVVEQRGTRGGRLAAGEVEGALFPRCKHLGGWRCQQVCGLATLDVQRALARLFTLNLLSMPRFTAAPAERQSHATAHSRTADERFQVPVIGFGVEQRLLRVDRHAPELVHALLERLLPAFRQCSNPGVDGCTTRKVAPPRTVVQGFDCHAGQTPPHQRALHPQKIGSSVGYSQRTCSPEVGTPGLLPLVGEHVAQC